MKRKLLSVLLCLSLAAGLAVGCGAADKDAKKEKADTEDSGKKVKIGMTLYSLKNEYTVRLANAAEDEAEKLGIELTVYDGNYDASTQISQVETMIADGCDGIILNPQDAEACSPCVDKAVEAGIPIVGVNTRVKNDKLTSYVGSEDVKAGEMETQALLDKVGTDAKIVIIEGPMGQSAQIERREGIQNILDKNPGVEVLAEKTANWSRSEAMTLMETWITTYGDEIDAVVSENDEMALGAREAIEAAGMDIPCIGIDGITDAVTAVSNGKMIASDFQNAEGQITGALETAVKCVNGEDFEKEVWIPFEMITPDNYADYQNKY